MRAALSAGGIASPLLRARAAQQQHIASMKSAGLLLAIVTSAVIVVIRTSYAAPHMRRWSAAAATFTPLPPLSLLREHGCLKKEYAGWYTPLLRASLTARMPALPSHVSRRLYTTATGYRAATSYTARYAERTRYGRPPRLSNSTHTTYYTYTLFIHYQ